MSMTYGRIQQQQKKLQQKQKEKQQKQLHQEQKQKQLHLRRNGYSVKAVLVLLVVTLFTLQVVLFLIQKRGHSLSTETHRRTLPGTELIKGRVPSPSNQSNLPWPLPIWITDYITWHNDMRAKFPGKQLFQHPDAPNIILRVCLGLCGGLHDRLGQLPWDLYLANQTKRVLFIQWDRPQPLENFLIPNTFNWSVPPDTDGLHGMKETRAQIDFFQGFTANRPEKQFWETQLDHSIERAKSGTFKHVKILRHILLGHLNENELEHRLQALGETDMLHWTPSFGNIFHAFFKLSDPVQNELDSVYQTLQLQKGTYTAVHCRVRHPKATPQGLAILGKNPKYPADKSGLPWHGLTKDFAVSIATHAIMCARTLSTTPNEPIYLFADSNDLVHYMVHELAEDPHYLANNKTLFDNPVDQAAANAVLPVQMVARDMTLENAHIDRQKGRPPPAYYATFVDLYLAIHARCVTYGIGFYALFATKISGTQCKLLYQEEEWGDKQGSKGAELCSENTIQHTIH